MASLLQIGLTNAVLSGALALAAATVTRLCRRPALCHALWLLVIVKLLTPPLIVIPIALPEHFTLEDIGPQQAANFLTSAEAEEAAQPADVAESRPLGVERPSNPNDSAEPEKSARAENTAEKRADPPVMNSSGAKSDQAWSIPDVPWLALFGSAWLVGSAIWFTVALTRVRCFHRLLKDGDAAPIELQCEASALAHRLGLRDCPTVWLVPGIVSPLLWAVAGTPKLLLPNGLLGRLDTLQRRTLLTHELAHYRRRDHWIRGVEFLMLGLYWWCPVAWWARRELRTAEEECCDAWVMWTLPEAGKAYASALMETLDFLSGAQPALPVMASGLGQLDLLRRRLAMIMRGTMPRQLGSLGFMAVLGLAVLLLPLSPTWGQQNGSNGSEQTSGTTSSSQPPKDLERTRAELERAKADLDRAMADLERARSMVNSLQGQVNQLRKSTEEKERRLKEENLQLRIEQGGKGTAKGSFGVKMSGADAEALKKAITQALEGEKLDQESLKRIVENIVRQAHAEAEKSIVIGKKGGAGFGGGGGGGGFGGGVGVGPGPGAGATPAMEKRLSDLERKVDRILEEIRTMRNPK
jgi:beta-lactamase regulating signal transducer with metallopeptidase domain